MSDPAIARGRERVLVILLVIVGLVYVVQLIRPLHLEHDSICYLRQAEHGVAGRGYACKECDRGGETCPILYPPGYPRALGALIGAGAADARSFALANLVFLAVAVVASASLWRRAFGFTRETTLLLSLLFLLSWPVFRYVNTPMSDLFFAPIAVATLLAASEAQRAREARRRGFALLLGVVLAWLAIEVRTMGVALLPALAWAVVWHGEWKARVLAQWTRHRARSAAVVLAGVALSAAALTRSQYFARDVAGPFRAGGARMLLATQGYRLTDFGELAINTSSGKLPGMALPLFMLAGAACLVAIATIIWKRRHECGPAEVFVLATFAIMVVYPWQAPRYWIPAVPVLLGLAAWWWLRAGRRARMVLRAALAVYVAGGIAGLAYSTRISLRGRAYFTALTDERLGPAYRAAWGEPLPGDTPESLAVRVIRQYGGPTTNDARNR